MFVTFQVRHRYIIDVHILSLGYVEALAKSGLANKHQHRFKAAV